MAVMQFPGQYLSISWWLWVASGLVCLGMFVALWFYYSRPGRVNADGSPMRISRSMAVFWATLVTLPGLVFAAGALWGFIQVVRVWNA